MNTDLLEIVLDSLLPPQNKDVDERYDELLVDLNHFNIDDVNKLRKLISKNMDAVRIEEKNRVLEKQTRGLEPEDDPDRVLNKGVFYVHAGLVRCALENEFQGKWRSYNELKHNM